METFTHRTRAVALRRTTAQHMCVVVVMVRVLDIHTYACARGACVRVPKEFIIVIYLIKFPEESLKY